MVVRSQRVKRLMLKSGQGKAVPIRALKADRVELQHHLVQTLGLGGCEWAALFPARRALREGTPATIV